VASEGLGFQLTASNWGGLEVMAATDGTELSASDGAGTQLLVSAGRGTQLLAIGGRGPGGPPASRGRVSKRPLVRRLFHPAGSCVTESLLGYLLADSGGRPVR
jgi:hypothetical protein